MSTLPLRISEPPRLDDELLAVPRIVANLNHRMGRPLDGHELADTVQDAIVVALQKHALYAHHAPIGAWIYRICAMEIMNSVRRKRRNDGLTLLPSDGLVAHHGPAIEERLARVEDVRAALQRLDRDEAEVVRLKHFEGLTFTEIVERVGRPSSTLKTRYYRAMTRLQITLRRYQHGD